MPPSLRLRIRAARSLNRLSASPPLVAPPGRRDRIVASLAYRGLQAAAVVSVLLAFGFASLHHRGDWFGLISAAFSLVLLTEGVLLASDWHGVRRTTVARLTGRRSQLRRGMGSRLHFGLLGLALQLLGVIWIAGGVFLAASATTTLT